MAGSAVADTVAATLDQALFIPRADLLSKNILKSAKGFSKLFRLVIHEPTSRECYGQ
jgi:hypothetical protein